MAVVKEVTDEIAQHLRQIYVIEKNSIRDTCSKLEYRTGIRLCERSAGRYIRNQGWTRSQSYYAKRSTFGKSNTALVAEAMAKRKKDEHGKDEKEEEELRHP